MLKFSETPSTNPVIVRRIYHGDLFDLLPTLDANSIDACVTDPPYGIGFMGKEWDTFAPEAGAKRVLPNLSIASSNPNLKGRTRSPASSPSAVQYDFSMKGLKGFQTWTAKWAREVFRVLKPGAHLIVCGGPRSFHRMTCGLEDAGFDIRDCVSWLYGTGFPKSLNVSKAIDEAAGAVREVIGVRDSYRPKANATRDPQGFQDRSNGHVTVSATEAAKQWEGWGTALKPGWEPIILARKPLTGTVAENVLTYGTGALNIDASRIETNGRPGRVATGTLASKGIYHEGLQGSYATEETTQGRWPANVILDEDAAALLDEQSGKLVAGGSITGKEPSHPAKNTYGDYFGRPAFEPYQDTGGASRFFYVAKTSRSERDFGCDSLPEKTGGEATDRVDGSAGVDNPRAGAGRTGGSRNIHPTVKPVDLMRHLVTLVTPPGGVVLDPFLGSGTTAIACVQTGFGYVGIEREAAYVEIAERRVAEHRITSRKADREKMVQLSAD